MIQFICNFQKDKAIVIGKRLVAVKGGGSCDYKGIALGAVGGDGMLLYPDHSSYYINLSTC